MSLLRIEGFEGFGTTTGSGGAAAVKSGLEAKYISALAGGSGPRIWAGWGNGYSIALGPDGSADLNWFNIPFGSSLSTVYCGMAVRPRKNYNSFVTAFPLFSIYDSANATTHTTVWIVERSTLRVTLHESATTPLVVVPGALLPAHWAYIEYKVVIHDTTGAIIIKVNGDEVANVTGLDTRNGTPTSATHLKIWGIDADSDTQDGCYCYDDVYIDDAAFLGPIKVEQLLPNGDTADEDWALSTGVDSYALIDENPKNDDTDYISSGTTTDKTLCDLGALAYLASNIKGVQINVDCKVDTGTVSLIPKIKSNVTEAGTTRGVSTTTYKTESQMFVNDPDTAGAWSVSAVNAAQAGVEVG